MNWLQIARRIVKECGIGGDDETPETIVAQTGEMLAVINWMTTAWQTLCNRKWDWLWENPDNLVIQSGEYTLAGTLSANRYVDDSMYDGTRRLTYLPWGEFRTRFPAALITAGTPSFWTVRPDRAIAVSAKPTADLTLACERYAYPAEIGDDDDEPPMPPHLHMAIVWAAVRLYAGHDEAGQLYQHAKAEYTRILGEAAIDALPDFEVGEPLC